MRMPFSLLDLPVRLRLLALCAAMLLALAGVAPCAPEAPAGGHEVAHGEAAAAVHAEGESHEGHGGIPEIPNAMVLLYEGTHDHEKGFGKLIKILHKGPLKEPLPIVGKLPWENHLFAMIGAVAGLLLFGAGVRQLNARHPSRMQAFVEMTVLGFQSMVYGILGEKQGKKFAPYIAALFIYILINNLMGIIPFMKPATSSLVTTGSLALLTFLIVQYTAIRELGPAGYLYHLAGEPKGGIMWAMAPLFFLLHIIGELAKPVSLALRLFGNILGKDILLGAFVVLGIGLVSIVGLKPPAPGLPLHFPFLFLGVLLSTIQALVFSLLTMIYILLVLPHEHEHHEAGHGDEHGSGAGEAGRVHAA